MPTHDAPDTQVKPAADSTARSVSDPISAPIANPVRITIARRRLFSTAHLYRQAKFSDAENRQHFGACYTEHGHGHNYLLEAFIDGEIRKDTGLVMNLTDLDRILAEVVGPLDHHHVNFDVPEFSNVETAHQAVGSAASPVASLVPTTENLALYCRDRLDSRLRALGAGLVLKKIRLFETDDLWVECE